MVVTLEEAQARLPELIDSLKPGESLQIVRAGATIARVTPEKPQSAESSDDPPKKKPYRVPGSAKGIFIINSEDDEHLEDFREYME